ncbi:MAG: KH domain-containing protein [Desulfovibrio sp.]|jgi:predicted RNA-binding protein YlqC (UPF0109 family)|nr:KH domain-containing protein [Desulfovibrio sp.]
MLKEYLEFIVKSLVNKPEEVLVTEVPGEQAVVYELRVAKEDLGKIIGRQGRTARAVRILLGAASTRLKKRSLMEIVE